MISSKLTPPARAVFFGLFVFFFAPAFTLAVKEWQAVYEWSLPVERWVDFKRIEIPDFKAGADPLMENHRTVSKSVLVDYKVELTDAETRVEVCQGGGDRIQMQPTRDDVWRGRVRNFLQSDCHTRLRPGRYFAEMTLCFQTPSGVERCLSRKSNTFEVTP